MSVVRGKLALVERLTGALSEDPLPTVLLTQEEKNWGLRAMAETRDIIGIIPTHRRDSRRWTTEGFTAVANHFLKQGYAVWLFWGPGEREELAAIERGAPGSVAIPPTSFREMAALFSRCQLMITNDNGPMHLAAAVGAPTSTIYGPTDPRSWNHAAPQFQAIVNEGLRCLGCNMNECPFAHECMTQLSASSVIERAQALLQRFASARGKQ